MLWQKDSISFERSSKVESETHFSLVGNEAKIFDLNDGWQYVSTAMLCVLCRLKIIVWCMANNHAVWCKLSVLRQKNPSKKWKCVSLPAWYMVAWHSFSNDLLLLLAAGITYLHNKVTPILEFSAWWNTKTLVKVLLHPSFRRKDLRISDFTLIDNLNKQRYDWLLTQTMWQIVHETAIPSLR